MSDAHRCRVICRDGVWSGHCPTCPGDIPIIGRGEEFRQVILDEAREHHHLNNCVDDDCECSTGRARRSDKQLHETLSVIHAARTAGPLRRGIAGWLRNRRMRRLLGE